MNMKKKVRVGIKKINPGAIFQVTGGKYIIILLVMKRIPAVNYNNTFP